MSAVGNECFTARRTAFNFVSGSRRAARARFTKRSPDPFTHREMFELGQALDLRHLLVGKQDLKPLAHIVSIP